MNKVLVFLKKKLANFYGEFYFLYTNNDANTTVISARILRKAPVTKPFT